MLNTVCLLLVCPAGSSNMVGYDGKMYLNDEGAQPSSIISLKFNHILPIPIPYQTSLNTVQKWATER